MYELEQFLIKNSDLGLSSRLLLRINNMKSIERVILKLVRNEPNVSLNGQIKNEEDF